MEGIKILSLFVAIGALFWIGLGVIAGSEEFGSPDYDVGGSTRRAGIVFAIAVVINIIAGRLDKKR